VPTAGIALNGRFFFSAANHIRIATVPWRIGFSPRAFSDATQK
jgi:hypothetical protein